MLSFSDYSANNQDKFLDDMIGAYMGFDTKFGTFLDDYKDNLEMLKFYNEQSLSFLDAGKYNRANGSFLENVIEENLKPVQPTVSGGGGYVYRTEDTQYQPVDYWGTIGSSDYSRPTYNYNGNYSEASIKELQSTIQSIVGDDAWINQDGKLGAQTEGFIEQILNSNNARDIAILNDALAKAGVSYSYGVGGKGSSTGYIGGSGSGGSGGIGSNITNADTASIQNYLNSQGYYGGRSSSNVDGIYGSNTTAAVKAFQASHPGLAVDGIVGPATLAAMQAAGYKAYASGIENGPVTYTGLAMLHGTPSSPEYVLNSDQAYSLLRYMATTKPEAVAPGCGDTIYNFTGGITMNGVNDPEAFFGELMKATSNRFNVTKNRY